MKPYARKKFSAWPVPWKFGVREKQVIKNYSEGK